MADEAPTRTSTDGARLQDAPPEVPLGTIGLYTLLRVLGEGGMGVVYLAHQKTPVDRRVALNSSSRSTPFCATCSRQRIPGEQAAGR